MMNSLLNPILLVLDTAHYFGTSVIFIISLFWYLSIWIVLRIYHLLSSLFFALTAAIAVTLLTVVRSSKWILRKVTEVPLVFSRS